jgi:hypothetical protein
MISLVWLLRSWKLQQLELLELDGKQEIEGNQVSGTGECKAATQQPGRLHTYLYGMIVIKRV